MDSDLAILAVDLLGLCTVTASPAFHFYLSLEPNTCKTPKPVVKDEWLLQSVEDFSITFAEANCPISPLAYPCERFDASSMVRPQNMIKAIYSW